MSETPKKNGSFIQVPQSSPTNTSPLQPVPVSRLSSLKDRFSFKPTGSAASANTTKQNVILLKKRYPYVDAKEIIDIYNASNRNLRETSAKLSLIPKPTPTSAPLEPKKDAFRPYTVKMSPTKDTKVVLNKPTTSIAARYLNKNVGVNNFKFYEPPGTKPKRKLVKGSRDDETTGSFIYDGDELDALEQAMKQSKKLKKKAKLVTLSDSEEEKLLEEDDFDNSSDEDVVMVSNQTVFDDRVLSFLNSAEKRDIVDIAGITPVVADSLILQRPFKSLYQIQSNDFSDQVVSKNSRKKLMGEKIVDKTTVTLKGYDAVDSLIKQCSEYGQLISNEIKKWGVGIDGKSGELELVEVDVDTDDNEVEEIHDTHHPKVVHLSDEEGSEPDDDSDVDYSDNDMKVGVKQNRRQKIRHLNNPKRYFKSKPALLAPEVDLKNYQQVGVNWLNLLYQNNLSCILADEMGLGKTFEIIAFLAHLKELKYEGPHLVVVPSSTLENWLREFEKFCPDLVVVPYYGTQQERADQRYELEDTSKYDVLVTTYNLATGNKYDQNFLRSCKFNVIVYDEGHMLKNSTSERYVKLMKLKANFRVLLTGTPLQNNLRELISLLAFILPDLFNDKKSDLSSLFDQKVTTKRSEEDSSTSDDTYNPLLSQQAISKAKTMMTPFVLRRKKEQVLKHLPAKIQFIENCEFVPQQKQLYDELIETAKLAKQLKLQKMADEKENKDMLKISKPQGEDTTSTNVIMQLRKASLHPLLFRREFNDDIIREMSTKIIEEPEYVEANSQFIFEDMQVMSDFELDRLCSKFPTTLSEYLLPDQAFFGSGKVNKLKELLVDIIEKRHERLLLFSLFTQMLDILERCLSILNIKFIRLDGQTTVNERQQIIDTFYQDETIPVFLLSTKAGGFGINLVCTNNVVIFDLSFNPHDDKQAEDRCHRVGQTKEVNVYRLITHNSIEENIYQMGMSKLQLDKSVSEEELLLSLI